MTDMMKAGLIFGLTMALKKRADAIVSKLKKAQQREEETLPDGVDKFRRTWRRKPALFVLR